MKWLIFITGAMVGAMLGYITAALMFIAAERARDGENEKSTSVPR